MSRGLFQYEGIKDLRLDQLAKIVERVTDGVGIADASGDVLYVNPSMLALLRPGVDWTRLHIRDFHPRWIADKISNEYLEIARNKGVWVGESAVLNTEQEEVKVSQKIIAHFENGAVVYYSTVIRPISDTLLGQVIESMRTEVYVYAVKSEHYIYANRSALDNIGYSMEELQEMPPARLRSYEECQSGASNYSKLIAGDIEFCQYERIMLRKNGSKYLARVYMELLKTDTELLVLELVDDVTEEKAKESALRESELRFSALFHASPNAVILRNMGGVIVDCNEEAQKLYTSERDDLVGENVKNIFNIEDDALSAANQALLENGHAFYRSDHKEDAEPIFEAELKLVSLDNIPHVLAHVRDVSDRVKAERELARRENLLQMVNNGLPVGLCHLSADEKYEYVNQQYADWMNLPINAIIGQTLKHIIGENNYREIHPYVLSALEGKPVSYEIRLNLKSPGEKILRIHYAPEWNELNQVIGFHAMIQDVSDERKLEADMLRARDLEQRRLGTMLHDGLCQRLTGIEYRMHALWSQLSDEQSAIKNELNDVRHMMQRALGEAKSLSRGMYPTTILKDGIITALKEVVIYIQELFAVDCCLEISSKNISIDLDRAEQVFRIVQEAAYNAAKHSGTDAIIINLDQSDDAIIASVKDNGKGMSNEPDAGMGLHLMRHRSSLIGAKLKIDSHLNKGTLVQLEVPMSSRKSYPISK